jgi:hypothetical protein
MRPKPIIPSCIAAPLKFAWSAQAGCPPHDLWISCEIGPEFFDFKNGTQSTPILKVGKP